MLSTALSCALSGVDGVLVHVETDIAGGQFNLSLVGLPDAAVRESRDRVLPAMRNSGYMFPSSRITINLAPADLKKEGASFDLPIALSILAASHQIPPRSLEGVLLFGELSLDGSLNGVRGALPLVLSARDQGVTGVLLPAENALEVAAVEGIRVYPARSLTEAAQHLTGEKPILCQEQVPFEELRRQRPAAAYDLKDVKGQTGARRALEIAAAGGHNILIVGSPGAGKSMMAKRLPTIMPDMSREEMIASTEIYSVAGLTSRKHPVIAARPFRSPHHTVSAAGLAGGGTVPRPGEISLAHNGVLFLDELPEFRTDALEVLRQPLEDGEVTVSRVSGTVKYPSRFMLVCAMNPCRCGWYGHPSGRCKCSPLDIRRYHSRISGPLLDRIDLIVSVPSLEFEELRSRKPGESSAAIKKRVDAARGIQRRRYGENSMCNAFIGPKELREYCALSPACEELMHMAFDAMGLTARSYDRILRVARTIADLAGEENIAEEHIAEAIQYRTHDFREG